MKFEDSIFIGMIVGFSVLLWFFCDFAEKNKNTKFRAVYMIPAVSGLVLAGVYGVEINMVPAYLAVCVLLTGLFTERQRIRKICCVAAMLLAILAVVICVNAPHYRAVDYTEQFEQAVQELEKHYVLTEEKQIDYDRLTKKYKPMFLEAYEAQDEVAADVAWISFISEFHDMHVSYVKEDADSLQSAYDRLYGNDYGLSLMTLSDGRTVAVNVEPDRAAGEAGIHNGTEILLWDGKDIAAQKKQIRVPVMNFAVKENAAFYDAILVAGLGGDQVEVTYLDDAGEQQAVTLQKTGSYTNRLEDTIRKLDAGTAISNLGWQDLSDDTTLLRLREMSYDAETYKSADYSAMKNALEREILAHKEQGFQNLILDLRCNGGGSGDYVKVLLELFSPEGGHTYAYDGIFDKKTAKYLKNADGTYQVGEGIAYTGQNLWGHGRIVLLVNAQTVSGGDHFVSVASTFPNVEVMGFTTTACAGQGIHAVVFEDCALTYSAVLLLQKDGSVFLDTDAKGTATVALDHRVMLDENAVHAIFEEQRDYVLEQAMQMLSEQ